MLDVSSVSINSLPYQAITQTENVILNQIFAELQTLHEEVDKLKEENQSLKEKIAAQDKRIAFLEIQQDKDFDEIASKINDHSEAINKCWQATKTVSHQALPRGKKTISRIVKIDEILKTRGPVTLKELEKILKIDPSTMTRILARLDKRRYEIHTRPGDEREKVLRFKVQIR